MWPSTCCLLASLVQLAAVAALPASDGSFSTIDLTSDIVSTIPLEEFGNFMTFQLEEITENPGLLDTTDSQDDESDDEQNKFSSEKLASPATKQDASPAVEEDAPPDAEQDSFTPCNYTRTRIEWRKYSNSDRQAFVNSISCLTQRPSANPVAYSSSTSRYEDFVRTHQKMTPKIHGNGLFLLWHRYFTYAFEQALRTECGFDRALPWWDETLDSGAFHKSSLFTSDYFGALPGPTQGSGTCVVDGRFANLTCHIGPGSGNVKHCLSRAVNETMTSQSSTAYVSYCAAQNVYGNFERCAETGPHAWAHNGIGSVMSDVYASPSDPIFFMHHLFVDHQYASWQEANNSRKSTVAASCADGSTPCTNTLTLQSVLDMNGLTSNAAVGNVINTQSGTICYKYDYY